MGSGGVDQPLMSCMSHEWESDGIADEGQRNVDCQFDGSLEKLLWTLRLVEMSESCQYCRHAPAVGSARAKFGTTSLGDCGKVVQIPAGSASDCGAKQGEVQPEQTQQRCHVAKTKGIWGVFYWSDEDLGKRVLW